MRPLRNYTTFVNPTSQASVNLTHTYCSQQFTPFQAGNPSTAIAEQEAKWNSKGHLGFF